MTRIQKQISLPSEYWKAIESNIDNRLVRSRGDALIGILEKVYPHLSKVVLTQPHTKTKVSTPITNNDATITTNQNTPMTNILCTCGHPESYHAEDGCMGEGGVCECKKFVSG